MKKIITQIAIGTVILALIPALSQAQNNVGIGTKTPDPSAALDITAPTQGLKIPNVALVSTNSASPIVSPILSLLVYNTSTQNDVVPGYYYWDGIKWEHLFSDNSVPVASVNTTAPIINTGTALNPVIGVNSSDLTGSPIITVNGGANRLLGTGGASLDLEGTKDGVLYGNGAGTSAQFTGASTAANQILYTPVLGGAPAWVAPNNIIINSDLVSNVGSVVIVTGGAARLLGAGGATLDVQGTNGGVLVGNGAGNAASFTGASVGPNQVLVTPTAGAIPVWQNANAVLTSSNITGSPIVTVTNGTGKMLGAGGVNVDVQGTLGGVLYGTGAGTSGAFTGAGISGQVLKSNGAGAPSWGTANSALTTSNITGSSVVTVANGTGQVVGATNPVIDVQGTLGGVMYGNGAGSSAAFTGAGTSGQILVSNGSGAPAWTTLAATLPTSNLTGSTVIAVTNGTGKVVGLGNAGVDVVGTAGGVLYGTGASSNFTTQGTNGQILKSQGAGAPLWNTPSNVSNTGNGVITVTSGAGQVVGASNMTLDVTGTNGGVMYGTGGSSNFTAAGTLGQILKSNGAATPTWVAPNAALTTQNLTSGGNNVVTISNNTGQVVGAAAPAFDVVGTNGGVLYGTGASSAFTSVGGAGNILKSNGAAAPSWVTPNSALTTYSVAPNAGSSVVVSNGTGQVVGSNMTLDVQGTNGGVYYGKGAGNPAAFTAASTAANQVLATTITGGVPTWINSNAALTTQNLTSTGNNVIAITNGLNQVVGAAAPTFDVKGTQGGVLYGTGTSSNFTALGTTGQVLKSNALAPPTWVSANSLLTTSNATGTGVVAIGNGTGQVVGATNMTVDVQGTSGGVIYGTGAGTSAAFTPTGTPGQVLQSNGTSAPSWGSANSAITTSNVTSTGVVAVGNGTGQVVGASNMTLDVAGTNGGVLYGTGASSNFTAVGAIGNILKSNGAAAPTWVAPNAALTTQNLTSGGNNVVSITNNTGQVVGAAAPAFDVVGTNGGVMYGTGTSSNFTAVGATGNILKSNGAAAPTWVAPNTTLTTQNLTSTGNNVVSITNGTAQVVGTATPTFDVVGTNGGVMYGTGTSSNFTTVGTTGNILQSNGTAAPSWVSANSALATQNLTSGGNNVVSITNTTGQVVGAAAPAFDVVGTNGGVMYGTGTSSNFTTAGTSGYILQSNGAAAPSWVPQTVYTAGTGISIVGNVISSTATPTSQWNLTGNSGTTAGANFLGTTDAQPLMFKVNGTEAGYIDNANGNTGLGYNTLVSNTGSANTATGSGALSVNTSGGNNTANGYNAMASNTTGNYNVAVGQQALNANVANSNNTAVGFQSLFSNTANNNVAVGYASLYTNTSGSGNTGIGWEALHANVTNANNTATGYQALYNNTSNSEVAVGYQALTANTTGAANTSVGYQALATNSTGGDNAAVGYQALSGNTTGGNNTAMGFQALSINTTGGNNTAMGYAALYSNTTGGSNVAVGLGASSLNTTGSNNVSMGAEASELGITANNNTSFGFYALNANTADNEVAIGYQALAANTIGTANTSVGYQSMAANTIGASNTSIGYQSMQTNTSGTANTSTGYNSLQDNTTGSNNTSDGYGVLNANTIGVNNTGVGFHALLDNTDGNGNVAVGENALLANDANNNTAVGYQSLQANTVGAANTAMGANALNDNTTGNNNTAMGISTLYDNTTGGNNTATGYQALFNNNAGDNTANGNQALVNNTSGSQNTAIGSNALYNNTQASSNVGIGYEALFSGATNSNNTGIGYKTLYNNTAGNSTAIGYEALYSNTSGGFNLAIGYLSLYTNTTGGTNTAVGYASLLNNTNGSGNVGMGFQTLTANTTGGNNTAIGENSLITNTSGSSNTGVGAGALQFATTASNNTTLGAGSLYLTTSGANNTAAGYQALQDNTTYNNNTAIGYQALAANTTDDEVAVGYQALAANTTGSINQAEGYQALLSNTTGSQNIAMGFQALKNNTTGIDNTGIGVQALQSNNGSSNIAVGDRALLVNTSGSSNVAVGYNTLSTNSTGNYNTAMGESALAANTASNEIAYGYLALTANTTGAGNTAIGYQTLQTNTTNNYNTATGYQALLNNISDGEVAVGYQALTANTTGTSNTAVGYQALQQNTTGYDNTAIGNSALTQNSTGYANMAAGPIALSSNTTGSFNTSTGGYGALTSNQTGSSNASYGLQSLFYNVSGSGNSAFGGFNTLVNNTGDNNSAFGIGALQTNTSGIDNCALGAGADVATATLSNATAIGYNTVVDASNKVSIGNTSVLSIQGQVAFTTYSDERVKNNVQENVPGLAFITALRPVTYHYDIDKENELLGVGKKTTPNPPAKGKLPLYNMPGQPANNWTGKKDIEKITFSGFLAQEVDATAQKIGYNFSGVDKSGKLLGIRYTDFIPSLVKSVQELNQKLDDKDATIKSLQDDVETLKKQVQELMKDKK